MKRLPVTLISLLIMLHAGFASAAVYKHIADDGSVFYSDKPLKKGDKAYKGEEIMKFKADKPKPPAANAKSAKPHQRYLGSSSSDSLAKAKKKAQAKPYESLSIVSPTDGSSVRSNAGSVTVQASLTPPLQTQFNHHLVFEMDGGQSQQSSGSSATFQNVDRGTHQFSARVQDETGKTLLQSGPISLTVHRFSVIRAKKAH